MYLFVYLDRKLHWHGSCLPELQAFVDLKGTCVFKAAKKAAIRDQLKICTIPSGGLTNRIIMHGKFYGLVSTMITVGKTNSKMLRLFVISILAVYIASIFNVAAYGRSVEDLVGVFSIQKTIKLGGSGECFGSTKDTSDPLSTQNKALVDDQPPDLAGFNLEPKVVKASSPQIINLTAHIIDDQGGLAGGRKQNLSTAWFVSPSGKQTANVTIDPRNRSAGNRLDGVFYGKIVLPKNSEIGTWRIDNLTLVDERGNRKVFGQEQMLRLEFPAAFLVT
jgi:hypothetical protein